MYSIARRCVLPAFHKEQAEVLLSEAALHSLADVFEAVPDPRGAHGLRYDLPFLVDLFSRCPIVQLRRHRGGRRVVSGPRDLAARRVWSAPVSDALGLAVSLALAAVRF